MPKLAKQKYTTAKGERKVNCYLVTIPKRVVEESEIQEDDEISVYQEYGMIVINKKYHCTCMECGFEWESGKDYGIQSCCPNCKVGDIHYDINGGNNDNQKQGIKENA